MEKRLKNINILVPALVFFSLLPLILQAQSPSSSDTESETDSSAAMVQEASDANSLKKMTLEDLMNMDVTSVAKAPEPFLQAPAAIQVVTGDEIRRSGASSIPEALRLADNLEVAQASSSGWDISARGFNAGLSNKLLVLMDGRAVYTPLYSGVYWNAQDYLLQDIDRIEVVSGPGGTLWGANAVNGVINITTKSAKDTQGTYVDTGRGSWLQNFGGVRYGGTLAPDVYFRVYGKYFNRGDEVLANGNSAGDSWNMDQGGFRMDADAGSQDKFTLQGDLYDSFLNMPQASQENFGGGNVLGRWSRSFSEDSDMSLQLYYDRTYFNSPLGPAGTLIDTLDTYDLDFQHRFPLDGGNRLTWGLGYRFTHDALQNTPGIGFSPSVLDHELFSGFVQDEIKLMDKLSLTLGSKVEHNDYTGFEYEPSARLAWMPAERQTLWAAVSRAVRMPSRIDHDVFIYSPLTNFFGDENFTSETVVAYELGYRAQLTQDWAASLSTFFNNYDNLRSISPVTANSDIIGNGLAGQTYGAELATDYQVADGWRLHAGYDLLEENIWVKAGQTDLENGTEDTADPQNQVFLRSSMDLPGNLEFDLPLRWVDAIFFTSGTTMGTVPSYLEMDARLGWTPVKNFEISVVGQNLLQNQHPEYGFPGPTQEQIARSVYGKATCEF